MKPERWRHIESLFHAARDRAPAERASFLTENCGGDDELRHEVESLLAEHERGSHSMESAASDLAVEWSQSTPHILKAGTTLGKYRIENLLGQGGMGAVFLAYDAILQRRLALKVLKSPDEDASSQVQLLREARSASALNHPNVCTIYEVGEESDWPFIAMEYIDGRTLCDVIAAAPLPIEDSVRYGIEIADALAHAHDRGVIHRDLKAANVIVSSSGHLKIVDFGLARRANAAESQSVTAQTRSSLAVGTPYAMAPEQVRGGSADARTDLWALGVLLYEMLTAARPFGGGTTADLFSSILRDAPVPMPPDTPGSLRQLVHKCLSKSPDERYQRAADVRLGLETIASVLRRDARPKSDPRIATGSALPPPPIIGTAGAVAFVGRESELAKMSSVWERAKGGQRQVILLGGEPGIGKTRLSMEFARQRIAEGATVLVGRSEEEGLVPYQSFVEALHWYVRVLPELDLRGQLTAIGGGAELGQLIPELVRRIPDLPVAPSMNPDGQRYRLFEAVRGMLAAASSARPILLIFDDLHWADKPTLLMLRHIVRLSDAASLCIVGTYRESEFSRTHPFAEMLADLRREPAVMRLSLRGLDEEQTRGLINQLAGPDMPARLASLVVDSTDGNPFFIAEMLRHLSETGALAKLRASGVGAVDLGLPEGVKEVIGQRLSRVSDECNRALTLAAVAGREFDLEVLLALGDLPEDQLLDAVDEAVRARLVGEVPGSPHRFSFMHALIRETLYGDLTSTRRMRLHRRLGEAIEQLAERRPTPPLADLAYHFAQAAPAGTADKAVDYATRAGDRAADGLAMEEAARFYEMALQSLDLKPAGPEADARRVDLHTRRARSFGALGNWALQKREVEQALRYLDTQRIDRRAELILELAEASFFLLDIPSMRTAATEALDLSEKVQRSDIASDAIGWLARGQQAIGDLETAIELDRTALARGKGVKGVSLTHMPLSLYLAGRTNEAVVEAAHAAESARSSRDIAFVMYSLSHFGLSLAGAGRYDEATAVFEEARKFGRKYGALSPLARATSMSAGFHLSLFDFEGAEALQSEARELAESSGFAPTVVSAGIDLLLSFARRHDPGRAEKLMRETAERMANTPGWHEWLWQLRLHQTRAELALARGELELAVSEAREGSRLSRIRRRRKYEALGMITTAAALHPLGRTHEAIAEAHTAVAIARQTSDPALLLHALDILLTLDGTDELAAEARALSDRIVSVLPNETMRRRFLNSEVVGRITKST